MHGKNGVTCVDCHMPKVQGKDGKVYTDHQIQNPFDAFDRTCANCHDQSKEKLRDIVTSRKKEVKDVMGRLEEQVVKAHFEAKAAWDAGATKRRNGSGINGYSSMLNGVGIMLQQATVVICTHLK